MKKLLIILILFVSVSFAQEIRSNLISKTVANNDSIAFVLQNFQTDGFTVDSIVFVYYMKGAIDSRLFGVNRGVLASGDEAYQTRVSTDSVTTTFASDSGKVLSFVVHTITKGLKGVNAIKGWVKAHSSGNDATDPNKLRLFAFIYRTK